MKIINKNNEILEGHKPLARINEKQTQKNKVFKKPNKFKSFKWKNKEKFSDIWKGHKNLSLTIEIVRRKNLIWKHYQKLALTIWNPWQLKSY